jgi:hypothetical protein
MAAVPRGLSPSSPIIKKLEQHQWLSLLKGKNKNVYISYRPVSTEAHKFVSV